MIKYKYKTIQQLEYKEIIKIQEINNPQQNQDDVAKIQEIALYENCEFEEIQKQFSPKNYINFGEQFGRITISESSDASDNKKENKTTQIISPIIHKNKKRDPLIELQQEKNHSSIKELKTLKFKLQFLHKDQIADTHQSIKISQLR